MTRESRSARIADASVTEGNAGTTNLVFTVTRSNGSDGAVSATWTATLPGGTVGASADDFAPVTQNLDIVNVGLKYGFGDANVSFGYTFNGFDEEGVDDSNLFVLSGDIGILPGVTLLADVSYNTEDLGAFEGGVNGENEQDDTYGGVLSVQLDY